VNEVSYTQNQSIDLSLTMTNNDTDNWSFDTFYGSVNGWGFVFAPQDGFLSIDAGTSADVSLTTPLSRLRFLAEHNRSAKRKPCHYGLLHPRLHADFPCDPLVMQTARRITSRNTRPSIPLYETATMRAGLLNIDWENRLVYLFVDGLVSKNIILTPVFRL
jgi:hypothetical protein